MIGTIPDAYVRTLRDLAERVREAAALADLLTHYEGLLRGRLPDPEGPWLDLYPSLWQVRQALQRRQIAWGAALDGWQALPAEARDAVPSPGDLLEEAEG